jgi:hypothetical protein
VSLGDSEAWTRNRTPSQKTQADSENLKGEPERTSVTRIGTRRKPEKGRERGKISWETKEIVTGTVNLKASRFNGRQFTGKSSCQSRCN